MPQIVEVFRDKDELAEHVSREIIDKLAAAVKARGRASFVLAGGSTPRPIYERIASAEDHALDWSKVVVAWGDERCVPPDDPASNFKLAHETLLTNCRPAAVVRLRGELGPVAAADKYEEELASALGSPRPEFDVVLLGLGSDGHTASLFPGEPVVTGRWAAPAHGPPPHPERVTLTVEALNAARHVLFVVIGANKAAAVKQILEDDAGLPAALIRPAGSTTWYLDAAAAGHLTRPSDRLGRPGGE